VEKVEDGDRPENATRDGMAMKFPRSIKVGGLFCERGIRAQWRVNLS
jgi:hypothetical protein